MDRAALLIALALVAACASAEPSPPPDAGASQDAGAAARDAGEVDAGPPAPTEPTDEALRGARWIQLAAAPRINGKQDDLHFVTPALGWSVNGLGCAFHGM